MPSPTDRLNDASSTYAKMQDPNWKLGKPKDLEDFSKGANQSGDLISPEVMGKIKSLFGRGAN